MTFRLTGQGIALRNALLAFGGFVAAAVRWQRFVGTLHVGPLTAALLVAEVAAGATTVAEWRTRREMPDARVRPEDAAAVHRAVRGAAAAAAVLPLVAWVNRRQGGYTVGLARP